MRGFLLVLSLLAIVACGEDFSESGDLIPVRIANVKDMGEGVAIVLQGEGAPRGQDALAGNKLTGGARGGVP